MLDPAEQARQARERAESQVQPYVAGLAPRLVMNYGGLFVALILINGLGAPLLMSFLPTSTATLIVFGSALLLLVYGWRWLENRNGATGLFVLYTRYSRQRRDLDKLIEKAESGEVEQSNIEQHIIWLEEAAAAFADRAQALGVEQHATE